MPQQAGFDPALVSLIVGVPMSFAGVMTAFAARWGNRKTQEGVQIKLIIESLQEENKRLKEDRDDLRKQIVDGRLQYTELRNELRECEALRRGDFEASVKKMFPEVDSPEEP